MNSDKPTIAKVLKATRKDSKLSVKDVVEELKKFDICISEKTLYGWESGHRQPDADTFIVLCHIYGIDSITGFSKITPEKYEKVLSPQSDQGQGFTPDFLPEEFNEFERFIEVMGYYTRLDGDHYRIHKGKDSVSITPEALKSLVRASKATVSALVQNLMGEATRNKGEAGSSASSDTAGA